MEKWGHKENQPVFVVVCVVDVVVAFSSFVVADYVVVGVDDKIFVYSVVGVVDSKTVVYRRCYCYRRCC